MLFILYEPFSSLDIFLNAVSRRQGSYKRCCEVREGIVLTLRSYQSYYHRSFLIIFDFICFKVNLTSTWTIENLKDAVAETTGSHVVSDANWKVCFVPSHWFRGSTYPLPINTITLKSPFSPLSLTLDDIYCQT